MQNYAQARHALGAEASLTIVCSSEAEANEHLLSLWRQIDTFEATFSRFRSGSLLTQVNQNAGEAIAIPRPFYEVVRLSLELAAESDGLYNPLILPALQSAGYKGSWPQPAEADPSLVYEERRVASPTEIKLTEASIQLPAGTALDLGGIGKGILLDQLADAVEGRVSGYWLSLGGDIINGGLDARAQPWQVDVADARCAGKVIAHTPILRGPRQAVTTSGVTKRRGVSGGTTWHHIIDPRTLKPAETDLLTATVQGVSAARSEVWAKCAIILGSKLAPSFLRDRAVGYALLQTAPPSSQQLIEVTTHGQ